MSNFVFRDLSPYDGDVTDDDDAWLERVAKLDPRDYRVGVEGDHGGDEWMPLIERKGDGRWWGGRYIGFMQLGGRRVVLEPRLGIGIIEAWLDQAFGLAAPPASARHVEGTTFIVRLLARLWCRSLDVATRHGLPLLRLPRLHEGPYVRGRLDTRRTLRLLGEGREEIASITHDRSLDHPATRAIVCADRVLAERLGDVAEWRTERVKQVMPHLRSAVGQRPRLPPLQEVLRVRYTPITLPFKRVAVLSHRISSRLGYSATDQGQEAEGILIDVAELWELFVLNCARRALLPGLRVEHGTTQGRGDHLFRSRDHDRGMGRLKPDVLVLSGDDVIAVLDAKYKRLVDSRQRPTGVEPSDLYQLAAYAGRYKPAVLSALLYPAGGELPASTAERLGPWEANGQRFAFRRLPTTVDACRAALVELLTAAERLEPMWL